MRLPSMRRVSVRWGWGWLPGSRGSVPHLCRVPWSGLSLPLRHTALSERQVVSSQESPYPLRWQAAVLSGTGPVGGIRLSAPTTTGAGSARAPWWWCVRLF